MPARRVVAEPAATLASARVSSGTVRAATAFGSAPIQPAKTTA
jgi:hypothetical protein